MDIITNGKTAGCILLLVFLIPFSLLLMDKIDLFKPRPYETSKYESTSPCYSKPSIEYYHDPPESGPSSTTHPTDPSTKYSEKNSLADSLSQFLAEWKRSQEQENLGDYMDFYHSSVDCRNMDYADLQHYQSRLFDEFYDIELSITNARYRKLGEKIEITFVQELSLDNYTDLGYVTLVLIESGHGYVIVEESWEPYY